MAKLANLMLADIDKDVVNFVPNFDNTRKEPEVLPSRFPNLLVNGSVGIAVGMATNVPPHNLGEVIDGTIYLMEHPDADVRELMTFSEARRAAPDAPSSHRPRYRRADDICPAHYRRWSPICGRDFHM